MSRTYKKTPIRHDVKMSRVRFIYAASTMLAIFVVSVCCYAQEEKGDEEKPEKKKVLRLIERPPFDRVTLTDKRDNDSAVLEVMLIPFPGRVVPEKPKKSESLRLHIYAIKGLEEETVFPKPEIRDVIWADIESVELYEQMVAEEARQLARGGESDPAKSVEAYEYFQFLLAKYPKVPGLQPALQQYLFFEARGLVRKKQFRAALAILEELHTYNPKYQHDNNTKLASALGVIFNILIAEDVEQGKFKTVHALLDRIVRQYGESQKEVIAKWQGQLNEKAVVKRDEAQAHFTAGRSLEAHEAMRKMIEIWPRVEGGEQLVQKITQQFPLVVVGVTQPGDHGDMRRMDQRAVRRIGRLTKPTLMDFRGYGPERAEYRCVLGEFQVDEDETRLTFDLSNSNQAADLKNLTSFDLSRHLLNLADSNNSTHDPAWSELVSRVQVENATKVHIDLHRRFETPRALLQIPLQSLAEDADRPQGTHIIGSRTATKLQMQGNPARKLANGLRRTGIVERYYDDPLQAVDALQRGEIDVVSRLFPADAVRLRGSNTLVVGSYAVPTVHVLIPNTKKPYLANRTFRRALVYGINRPLILNQDLLRGGQLPDCRVVSGPFPTQITDNEILGVAYDESIKPRAYEPKLAITLAELAERQLAAAAKERDEAAPKRPTFVLGHPADLSARLACQTIEKQLKPLGINCRLKELPPGVTDDPKGECDLLYVELAMWNPIVDASRLLGPGGIAPSTNPYVSLALRQLEQAQITKDVVRSLRTLHRRLHDEVSVIPLWQTVNYFAHSRSITGVESKPVFLYQNLDRWSVTLQLVKQ